jgi:hypothetical protein
MQHLAVLSFLVLGTSKPGFVLSLVDVKCICRTAKVWKNFTLAYDLKGHGQSVWAVVAIDEERFLTGARTIYVFILQCSDDDFMCRISR